MDVRTCRKCKRLFNYVVGPFICPICREEIEAQFQVVKKYIDENTGCKIEKVAEACDVDVHQIKQWVREERLQFSSESIDCINCGVAIKTGRYCDKCRIIVANELNTALGNTSLNAVAEKYENSGKKTARMRFLDK